MKILLGVLLIIHGFIVTAQSSGSFNPVGGIQNPSWLNWWQANLGQSWLLSTLGVERTLIARAGGLLWLVAGITLLAAGLGVLGVIVPLTWWRRLALCGAVLSLVMLVIYLHPFYVLGLAASIILLIALISEQWSILKQLGL